MKIAVACIAVLPLLIGPGAVSAQVYRLQSKVLYYRSSDRDSLRVADSVLFVYNADRPLAAAAVRRYYRNEKGLLELEAEETRYSYTALGDTATYDAWACDTASGHCDSQYFSLRYDYNPEGLRTKASTFQTNVGSPRLTGSWQELTTYDQAGRKKLILDSYIPDSGRNSKPVKRERFNYTSSGAMTVAAIDYWDTLKQRWICRDSTRYSFDPRFKLPVQRRTYLLDDSTGKLQARTRERTISRDARGRSRLVRHEYFDRRWRVIGEKRFVYGAKGQIDSCINGIMDASENPQSDRITVYAWTGPQGKLSGDIDYQLYGDDKLDHKQYIYHYESVPVNSPIDTTFDVQCSTAGDSIRIRIPMTVAGDFTLRIADAQGREQRRLYCGIGAAGRTISLETSKLPAGTYLLRMTDSQGAEYTAKFLVAR